MFLAPSWTQGDECPDFIRRISRQHQSPVQDKTLNELFKRAKDSDLALDAVGSLTTALDLPTAPDGMPHPLTSEHLKKAQQFTNQFREWRETTDQYFTPDQEAALDLANQHLTRLVENLRTKEKHLNFAKSLVAIFPKNPEDLANTYHKARGIIARLTSDPLLAREALNDLTKLVESFSKNYYAQSQILDFVTGEFSRVRSSIDYQDLSDVRRQEIGKINRTLWDLSARINKDAYDAIRNSGEPPAPLMILKRIEVLSAELALSSSDAPMLARDLASAAQFGVEHSDSAGHILTQLKWAVDNLEGRLLNPEEGRAQIQSPLKNAINVLKLEISRIGNEIQKEQHRENSQKIANTLNELREKITPSIKTPPADTLIANRVRNEMRREDYQKKRLGIIASRSLLEAIREYIRENKYKNRLSISPFSSWMPKTYSSFEREALAREEAEAQYQNYIEEQLNSLEDGLDSENSVYQNQARDIAHTLYLWLKFSLEDSSRTTEARAILEKFQSQLQSAEKN